MPYRGSEDSVDSTELMDRVEAHAAFIDQSGDIMQGALNMNNNRLTGLPTPSSDSDAANKEYVDITNRRAASRQYVDNKLANYLVFNSANNNRLEVQYPLDMKGEKITNINAPSDSLDAANKGYVDCRTRVYGFRLLKSLRASGNVISSGPPDSDSDTYLTIVAPNGVHPNQIMLIVPHPYIRAIYRGVQLSGTHRSTEVNYKLVFRQVYPPPSIHRIIVEGAVYILPHNMTLLHGNRITLSVESEVPTAPVNQIDGINENEYSEQRQ